MKKYSFALLILALIFLFSNQVFSSRAIIKKENNSKRKLALVVGNSLYKYSPLKNPVNDASDISIVLKKMGFEVIYIVNANQKIMKKAINSFGNSLRTRGGIGLFYYAGHGIQINGQNYLIPVDADIESESDIEFESVNAGRILGKMEDAGNDINIILLDACRNNPYAKTFRSINKGLARMDAPKGSIVSYSTAPGSVAADGEGRNGVYTKYLIKYIQEPGLTIEQVMKKVRVAVLNETNEKQIPWESTSLTGNFFFCGKPETSEDEIQNEKNLKRKEISFGDLLKAKIDKREDKSKEELNEFKTLINDIIEYKNIDKSNFSTDTLNSLWNLFREKYPLYTVGIKTGDIKEMIIKAANGRKEFLIIARDNNLLSLDTFVNSIGQNFVYIKPGSFMMGSDDGDSDETVHKVILTNGFYMQTTEVTQKQWFQVMGENPSYFKGDNNPVEFVSWNNVKEFIKRLNIHEGVNKYRLPTEAEWEYSCRAGSNSKYGSGFGINSVAWYERNSVVGSKKSKPEAQRWYDNMDLGYKTHPVAQKKPNKWGLYDMHGNVWEWCEDLKGKYPAAVVTDPKGPLSGSNRICRGGGCDTNANGCRSANRYEYYPSSSWRNIGFRLVRNP